MQAALPADPHRHPALRLWAAAPHHHDHVEVRVINSQLAVPELLSALQDVDVISAFNGVWLGARAVPWPMPSATELAQRLPRLKLIQMTSAGFNALDIESLAKEGVYVANNGGANAISVAEHTMMLILGLQRQLLAMSSAAQSGRGVAAMPQAALAGIRELAQQTVGIVGFGNVGRQMARRLSGFGCHILYYDAVPMPPGRDAELGANQVSSLGKLLAASDVVTVHVPLLSTTEGLLGEIELRTMKRGSTLINTSRVRTSLACVQPFVTLTQPSFLTCAAQGAVVDEAALVQALDEGHLAAAGIDVTVVEPLPLEHPLLGRDNVLLTPRA